MFKVETFKILAGTKYIFLKKHHDGKIREHIYTYPNDSMGITGECDICNCFPCEHTGFIMDSEWQEQQKTKILG